jgi:LmbE family N-acetylglucosaminyl deacetylase
MLFRQRAPAGRARAHRTSLVGRITWNDGGRCRYRPRTVPAVILSPHPDDAVLSLWHLLDGDGEVAVLNVFGGSPAGHRGDAWWDRLTGAPDPVARAAERHSEDRAALAIAGREPTDLGFLDGQYRDAEPPLDPVVERIAQTAPEGVLLAPAALDRHRDHLIVRAAALALRTGGREVGLYADVPHATVYGWPAWVTGEPPDPLLDPGAHWELAMAGTGISLRDLPADVRVLAPEALERKLAAVRAYRTQLPALEAQFGVLRPEVLGREVTWRVTA